MKQSRYWLLALLAASVVSLGPMPGWFVLPVAGAAAAFLLGRLGPRMMLALLAVTALQGAAAGWVVAELEPGRTPAEWAAAATLEAAMVALAGLRRSPALARAVILLASGGLFTLAGGPLASPWTLPAVAAAIPLAMGAFLSAAGVPAVRPALVLGGLTAAIAVPLFLLHPIPVEAVQSLGWRPDPAAVSRPAGERLYGDLALAAPGAERRRGDRTMLVQVEIKSGLEHLPLVGGKPALYLREKAADAYVGGRWVTDRPTPGPLYPPGGRLVLAPAPAGARILEAEVLRVEPRYVPEFYGLAGRPLWVEGAPSYAPEPVHHDLRAPAQTEPPRIYRFASHLHRPPGDEAPVHPDPAHRDLYLMESELLPLAQAWVPPGLTAVQRAEAIRLRLRSECMYGTPPAAAGTDRTLHFLTEGRQGECGEFASAAVLLMRAADLPARFAVGYLSTELHVTEVSTFFVVRASDAHAWAEVRLRDEGWVVVDATPPAPPTQGTTVFPPSKHRRVMAGPVIPPPAWDAPIIGYRGPSGPWVAGGILAMLLAGAVVSLLARTRVRGAAARRRPDSPAAHALPFFNEFLRMMRSFGQAPRPGETIGDFAARLPARYPAASVARLVGLYEAVRFGLRSLTEADRSAAREALADLRRA